MSLSMGSRVIQLVRLVSFLSILVFAVTALSSCKGGGGGGGSSVKTGQFIDSPVQGLDCATATNSGTTDDEGSFTYKPGEEVTFSLGDCVIGTTTGKEIVTPVDLVPGALDETDPTVTNILRFLQSLDDDCDLDNMIGITPQIAAEVSGRPIIFNTSIEDFGNGEVADLFDTLNDMGAFTCDTPRELRSAEAAQEHFREVLAGIDGDGDGFSEIQGDCNDTDASIHPASAEICGDEIDQDCNGSDLACPTTTTTTTTTTSTTTTTIISGDTTTTTSTLPPTTTTSTTTSTTTTTVPTTTTTTTTTTSTSTTTSTTTTSTTTTTIPSYTQEDLEGIWAVDIDLLDSSTAYDLPDRYHFIDETGELINVEPVSNEIIYDFSGNFVVGSVTGNSWLDHQHNETSDRHITDIYYDGQFVNANEIEADWDVPNALNGISKWYRVPYEGIWDQALIDSENALILAQDANLSIVAGAQFPISYLTGTNINIVDAKREGSCGGDRILNGTIDPQTGVFSGMLEYNYFCDEITDGITVNGDSELIGHTDLVNKVPYHYQNIFTELTFIEGDQSFSINGRKGINFTRSPHVILLSYVFTNNNTGISYWLKDFFYDHIHGDDYVESQNVIGRFYDPDYGYVELSVEEAIRTYGSDYWPSSGKLVLTGAEGAQGGDTKIRITYLSATEYLVEADTNGDGSYDYNSGTLLFADLL